MPRLLAPIELSSTYCLALLFCWTSRIFCAVNSTASGPRVEEAHERSGVGNLVRPRGFVFSAPDDLVEKVALHHRRRRRAPGHCAQRRMPTRL